jgi:squalene-associated FAD-dependent desaturase
MKIGIIGAGWAGMAAAVRASQLGHQVTVFEASRTLGGRARALDTRLPDGTAVRLDNGQHILIGAYSETLKLMRDVGVNPDETLLRLPLTLKFPDDTGLALPNLPAPLDALVGIFTARGWGLADKLSLLRQSLGWQIGRFTCTSQTTVAQLCQGLTPRILQELIEPLCVSALNTPAYQASGQVFLTVLRDSLFGGRGSSNLLLPKVDLTQLFPQAAAKWLGGRGGEVRLGSRVSTIEPVAQADTAQPLTWQVLGEPFGTVILATSASNVPEVPVDIQLLAMQTIAENMRVWRALANALHYEAITTVYAYAPGARLAHPMQALRGQGGPAQFVFDRGQLGGHPGLLAFVVSASHGDRETLQDQVLAQAKLQLGLALQAVQTVVEKRATFACTPNLNRPPTQIAPGLLACGDYIEGPYPATLEGAVRSGLAAANLLIPAQR